MSQIPKQHPSGDFRQGEPEANRYPPHFEAADRQARPGTPERFDQDLEALKRENQRNRRALDSILREITAREAESPRQRLAADLLQILVGENLTELEGEPWRLIPEMAVACLEAAEKIYPEANNGVAVPQSFDARDWAREFVLTVRQNPAIATDEGTMIGWFSNALMRGFDERAWRDVDQPAAEPSAAFLRETVRPQHGFDPEAPALLDEIRRAQQMTPEEFRREYESDFPLHQPIPPPPADDEPRDPVEHEPRRDAFFTATGDQRDYYRHRSREEAADRLDEIQKGEE
jgi:hypothetical protein